MLALALALQHGASANDVSRQSRRPPLHLATVWGTAAMGRLLLQHGAQVATVDEDRYQTAVEFALDPEFFVRNTPFPILVDPAERTEMLLALLAAGAGRPFTRVDTTLASTLPSTESNTVERPAADYLLWPALAALTRGGEVMEAFARTGTQPAFDADTLPLSPLAHAARSGNLGGLRWLLPHSPRIQSDDNKYLLGERQYDTWLLAASWALYPTHPTPQAIGARDSLDAILDALLQPGMPWAQNNRLRDDERDALLHHLVFTGHTAWVQRVVALGAPVDGTGEFGATPLLQAVQSGNPAMVRRLLSLGADPLAAAKDSRSALLEAIAPSTDLDSDTSPAQQEQQHTARQEILTALTPAQKAQSAPGTETPLQAALRSDDTPDGRTVATLLDAGMASTVGWAVRLGDIAALDILLAHGGTTTAARPGPAGAGAAVGQRSHAGAAAAHR